MKISRLTGNLLERFTSHLNAKREIRIKELVREGKRVPSNRAVSLCLGSVRHLFNEAKKQYNDYDRNIILISGSSFENFKIPKQEATRKRAISAELIRQIYKLPYLPGMVKKGSYIHRHLILESLALEPMILGG